MKILTKLLFINLIAFQCSAADINDSDSTFKFDAHTENAFSRNPKITINKDGHPILNANDAFANITLTRVGKNGKIETYCTSNEISAKMFLEGVEINVLEGEVK